MYYIFVINIIKYNKLISSFIIEFYFEIYKSIDIGFKFFKIK